MFSPLQVISSYSLLQSGLRIEDYVQAAKKLGYQALALTDYNVMYGALTFYQACLRANIKPLVGITLQLTSSQSDLITSDIVLIAKNAAGYQNLMKLSSLKLAKPEGVSLTLEQVDANLSDLIVILPPNLTYLIASNPAANLTWLTALKARVASNLYFGIEANFDEVSKQTLIKLAEQLDCKLVASLRVEYLEPKDILQQEVLAALKSGRTLKEAELQGEQRGTHYLKSLTQVEAEYEQVGLTEAYANVAELCQQVDLQLEFTKTKLPHFKTPSGLDSESYLRKLCVEGLDVKLRKAAVNETKPYFDRLESELAVINKMGFDDYFLIVADITNFARSQKIMLDPGRGSAAGSLVAYSLGITDVDPLKYQLLFERFLNEKRAQMPDIDIDLPDNRRDEVISHLKKQYGQNHLAQIITFDTFGARQALRDVGRVLELNSFELEKWSQAIPRVFKISLKEAYEQSRSLRNLVNDSSKNKLLFRLALSLEGLPRHYSKHAAGIILSDTNLVETVPLHMGNDGIWLSQYAKKQVEAVGLLKIDLLGLRNLSLLEQALSLVKRGYQTELDVRQIDLNDELTLQLFARGDTAGVFQFESSGIRNVLRKLRPTSFEDIAAVNALYRPGPLANIDEFIARKHGLKQVTYPNDNLKSILGLTYGIIVYQEQVMQVASTMAGFTLGEADILRRAISSKNDHLILELKDQFIKGAKKLGYEVSVAKQVYDYIERFANYGFNRSHAVAYSKFAFQLAYIKAHYPAAFYTALFNSLLASPKIREYVIEAKKYQVNVKGPNINLSQKGFTLRQGQIYFGLASIKKIRRDFCDAILLERRQAGNYKGFQDFLERIPEKYRQAALIEPLIYVGAFDEFEPNRKQLLTNLESQLKTIELTDSPVLQSLLETVDRPVEPFSLEEQLDKESEYLGLVISGHLLQKYSWIKTFYPVTAVGDLQVNMKTRLLVYIRKIKVIRTKNNEEMAFLTGSDESGEVDLTLFPTEFRRYGLRLKKGQSLLVSGEVQEHNGLSFIVKQIKFADLMKKTCWYLRLTPENNTLAKLKLTSTLRANHGETPVIIYDESAGTKRLLHERYWLSTDAGLEAELINLLGQENVVLKK